MTAGDYGVLGRRLRDVFCSNKGHRILHTLLLCYGKMLTSTDDVGAIRILKEATNVDYNTLPPYQSIPEESGSRRGVKVREFRLDGVNI